MTNLNITERLVRGVTILDLDGKVTIGECSRQLHDVVRQIKQDGKTRVLLNLAKVTYIDSSGLGEIVAAYTTIKAGDGMLKLINVPGRVTDLMFITKLYTVFEIFDSESEGVASFEAADIDTAYPTAERSADVRTGGLFA
jgi:anti-sigma B factor antagonist